MKMSPGARLDAVCSENRIAVPDCRPFAGYPIQYYNVLGKSTAHIGQTRMGPGGWGSHVSRQSAHDGGKAFIPKHRPSLPTRDIPGWDDASAMVLPEGLCKCKIPMTPSGMDPANFRLVARYLNQLRQHAAQCCNRQLKGTTKSEFTKFFIKLPTIENIASLNTDVGASQAVDLSLF